MSFFGDSSGYYALPLGFSRPSGLTESSTIDLMSSVQFGQTSSLEHESSVDPSLAHDEANHADKSRIAAAEAVLHGEESLDHEYQSSYDPSLNGEESEADPDPYADVGKATELNEFMAEENATQATLALGEATDPHVSEFVSYVKKSFEAYRQLAEDARAQWYPFFQDCQKSLRNHLISAPLSARDLSSLMDEIRPLIETGINETTLAKSQLEKKPRNLIAYWVREPAPFSPKSDTAVKAKKKAATVKVTASTSTEPAPKKTGNRSRSKSKKDEVAMDTDEPISTENQMEIVYQAEESAPVAEVKGKRGRKAESLNGPWRFNFVVPSGQQVTSVGVRIRAVSTDYQMKGDEENADLPIVAPHPKGCYPKQDGDSMEKYWQLDGLTFTSSSGGKAFALEFQFTVQVAPAGLALTTTLTSTPMVVVSNISQWSAGEGSFVAFNTFGGVAGPVASAPYYLFFNMLQYSHLLATRQIASANWMETLYHEYQLANEQISKKRAKADSNRSKKAAPPISFYFSYKKFERVRRLLTETEVKNVFPPTIDNSGFEWISYETMAKNWLWYGNFLYHLYTGTKVGTQYRLLWLDNLIHLVPPGVPPYSNLTLDHGIGTGILRTSSSTPGELTLTAVVVDDKPPGKKIVSTRPQITSNDCATALLAETGLVRMLDVVGNVISKNTVVNRYRKAQEVVMKDGYVENLHS